MSSLAPSYEVLVVDDSPVYRKLIQQILCGHQFSLSFASNGSEAIRLYKEKSPNIVVTDWVMPDFSGLELCQHIRADKSSAYTYIVLMTSNTEKDGVVTFRPGVLEHVHRPGVDTVLELILVHISRR